MNMLFEKKLPIPQEIKDQLPITPEMEAIRDKRAEEIADIFSGNSEKFLLIIGPCSADNSDAVLEYMERLKRVEERVNDKIFIIPRIYTNKPRTTGDGYKGMLHQPDPHEKPDMLKGIIAIRELHLKALRDYGFTAADEMLYPENHRYLSDLLGYVAVGARSTENQQHRLTASGVGIPVGMKNTTEGDLDIMMNSITAAQHPHTFIYRGWEVHSGGNPFAHAILRGYIGTNGKNIPNYHYENLIELSELYAKRELKNPAVIVDCNHANSGKQYNEQPRIAKDVITSIKSSDRVKKITKGLMIESYLEDGAQKVDNGIFGKSITDPCLGWKKTEKLVLELADML